MSHRPPLQWLALALVVLVGVVAGAVPQSQAAFTARVTNSANKVSVRAYFTCAGAVAAATPAYYYRMDETSGTAATDSSGNNRTGVYSSTGRTPGAARACTRDTGTAMTFDGAAGYLSSPSTGAVGPNVFTLEIWFKTSTTRGGKLIGWGNSQVGASLGFDRHVYMTNAGTLIFGVKPLLTNKTIATTASYNDNAWHQMTATLSGAGMKLYVDGDLKASDSTTTTGEGSLVSGYWRIAFDNLTSWPSQPTSSYFAGTLDDAAVYYTALSDDQVKNHYLAGI